MLLLGYYLLLRDPSTIKCWRFEIELRVSLGSIAIFGHLSISSSGRNSPDVQRPGLSFSKLISNTASEKSLRTQSFSHESTFSSLHYERWGNVHMDDNKKIKGQPQWDILFPLPVYCNSLSHHLCASHCWCLVCTQWPALVPGQFRVKIVQPNQEPEFRPRTSMLLLTF